MPLIHDLPSSEGVRNGLKRAKRMVDARYTPVRQYPIVTNCYLPDGTRVYQENYAHAFLPVHGLPYSSVRRVEKYIGYNVLPETFVSALTNPDSVVYTRPITGTGQNVHNYYGIVCSCFVSEVLDFPYRTPCARIPFIPGVAEIPAEPLENLSLLDIILNVKRHVAVITDIERDELGIVRYITVSESVLPYCRRTRFTPDEFRGYWLENDYRIFRYAGVDRISYEPDPFLPIPEDGPVEMPPVNRIVMTDYGNKANYRLGENVTFRVFDAGFGNLCVGAEDGTVFVLPVEDGKCVFPPEKPGHYSACAVRGEEKSDPVFFCVTGLCFTPDKRSYATGETIRLAVENPAGDPVVAWQFNKCASDRGCGGGYFSEPLPEGEIELTCPDVREEIELYLMAKNEYGIYTSERVKFPEPLHTAAIS